MEPGVLRPGASSHSSFAVGYFATGRVPYFGSAYSLAQKSGGPSLSATLWFTGFKPRLRYAAIAINS